MARAPNEKVAKAKELFDKGYRLIDISKELDIPDGTVRRWKKTYAWGGERKSERSVKDIQDEVKEVIENSDLNDKQKLFCVAYCQSLNATKAYLKIYKCTYETAMINGPKQLRKPKIKKQIDKFIAEMCNKEFLRSSVIQKYIDIAFADIGDYLVFGKKYKKLWSKDRDGNDIPVMDVETGEQKEISYNYVDLKESAMVDTTLISKVSQGKDGIKFELADKMRALEFLTKHCNLLSDEEKIKLDVENKKLQNEKLKAEIDKVDNTTVDGSINELVDAIKRSGK